MSFFWLSSDEYLSQSSWPILFICFVVCIHFNPYLEEKKCYLVSYLMQCSLFHCQWFHFPLCHWYLPRIHIFLAESYWCLHHLKISNIYNLGYQAPHLSGFNLMHGCCSRLHLMTEHHINAAESLQWPFSYCAFRWKLK